MQRIAWIYISAVIGAATVLSFAVFWDTYTQPFAYGLLFIAIVVASLMRTFVISAPRYRSYEGSTIVLFASIWLFSPSAFIVIVVSSHLIEWAKERAVHSDLLRVWYIQPFNIAKTILSGLVVYEVRERLEITLTGSFDLSSLLLVLLVVVIYIAINQLLLAFALLLARGISLRSIGIIRDMVLLELPLACIGYLTAGFFVQSPYLAILMLAPIALIYQAFLLPKVQDEAYDRLEQINQELMTANLSIQQLNDELFLTLAKLFDARDPYVGGHAAQVAIYAVAIAEELGLSAEQTEIIRQSAYLHDIGKIAIPEIILHKSDRLTDHEYEFIKRHANIGADFIATSHGLRHLAPFVRHHHERWDGQGYPDGLAGEEIPFEARILALCDSVEAMASDRPYHKALSIDEIITEVQNCVSTQFDPQIAAAFIRITQQNQEQLVVNSARTITLQYAQDFDTQAQQDLPNFAEIYGMVLTT